MDNWVLAAAGMILIGLSLGLAVYAGDELLLSGFQFLEEDLRDKLRRLRVSTRSLRKFLIVWLTLIAIVFFSLWLLLEALSFGILFAVILFCGPWYMIRRWAEKRRQQIEDQLADAMVSLASAIKAGLSLAQALEILADQCPRPISQEFQLMVGEYKLGKTLERVLTEARDRLRSENFALFAASMEASRESGGKLNETVERIATSVMELQRLERKVIAETAQARTSALYMAMAPAAVLIMYYLFIDPINTERLFTTVPGQLMLCASVVFNIIAYLWARAILNPDI